MKLFLAMAVLAAASLQGAIISQVDCTNVSIPGGAGNTPCAGLGSAVGFQNLTLQIDYRVDVTIGGFGGSGSMTTSLDSPLTNWDVNPTATVNESNRGVNGLIVLGTPIAISASDFAANFQNAFNVAVGAGTYTGQATAGNVDIRFILSGDPIPNNDVPEPTTFALFGLGIVGLGLLKRRS
ncbi:MAG: PEP-CTERM sorting domain-containing protein [Bryobacterales bacterium]|nr:PEP-CTERM sorting domain-containing protein [Bryobacterales bacterium]